MRGCQIDRIQCVVNIYIYVDFFLINLSILPMLQFLDDQIAYDLIHPNANFDRRKDISTSSIYLRGYFFVIHNQ